MPKAKTITVTLTIQVEGDVTETTTVEAQTPMTIGDRTEYELAVDALSTQLVKRVVNFWPTPTEHR